MFEWQGFLEEMADQWGQSDLIYEILSYSQLFRSQKNYQRAVPVAEQPGVQTHHLCGFPSLDCQ